MRTFPTATFIQRTTSTLFWRVTIFTICCIASAVIICISKPWVITAAFIQQKSHEFKRRTKEIVLADSNLLCMIIIIQT